MAKKFRCPRPINRLLMHRTRGLSGPMFQNIGQGRCMTTPGNFIGSGGGGGAPSGPMALAGSGKRYYSSAVFNPTIENISFTDVPGTNRLMVGVVHATGVSDRTITTVTLNGSFGVKAVHRSISGGGSAGIATIFYWLDSQIPTSGTYNCTMLLNNTSNTFFVEFFIIEGIDQTTPLGTTDRADGLAQVDAATFTTNLVGETGNFIVSTAQAVDNSSAESPILTPSANLVDNYTSDWEQNGSHYDTHRVAYAESCASADEDFIWTLNTTNTMDLVETLTVAFNKAA